MLRLRWLDGNLASVLEGLPAQDLSLLEVSLFCSTRRAAFACTAARFVVT